MNNSREKITQAVFCALDLETTGTNPALHKIVEVGAVRFTMDGIVETFSTLVNPGMRIPDETIRIHGITDDMVRDAPEMGDVLDGVAGIVRDALLVIHNPGFDLSFIGWAFRGKGHAAPVLEAVDTVRIARLAWPELPNYRLDTVCGHIGTDLVPHRALPDARASMSVFKHAIMREDPGGVWTMADLFRFHGRPVRMKKVDGRRIRLEGKKMLGLQLGQISEITYVDQSGALTVRTIRPKEFIIAGDQSYVLAHCHLRGDVRYFKIDRIKEIR